MSNQLIFIFWILFLTSSCHTFIDSVPDFNDMQSINCNQELTSGPNQPKSGTFTSPGYPNPYPSDITCRYLFQGLGAERVQIIFNEIELKPPIKDTKEFKQHIDSSNCDDVDAVTVTVFIGGLPRDIGVYCGNKRPPMLMSNDNRLEVTFVTRGNNPNFKGFKANYNFVQDFGIKAGQRAHDMVCGFQFRSDTTPNGTFTSPNFPGLYPRNTECHYLFFGKDNEMIYITFPYFDVEGVSPLCNEETDSDYVEFSNFNVLLTDRKMNRLCGTKAINLKNDVNSDGNFFRVTFKSNDAYDATGFEAFYQFRRSDDPYAAVKRTRSSAVSIDVSFRSLSSTSWLLALFIMTSATRLQVLGTSQQSVSTATAFHFNHWKQ